MILNSLSSLTNHLWQSTFCVAVVWLLTLALKKNHAAIRHWLWFAASVKFLLPFSLLVGLGSYLGRSLGWGTARALPQIQWSVMIYENSRSFPAPLPILPPIVHPASHSIPSILLGIWLCGFAVSVLVWLRCWLRVRALRAAATPIEIAMDLPIPVMSSSSLQEPGVFGIFRPVLLLPEGIANRLTSAQLDAILTHEMCHVRRRDNLTAAIHMVIESLFWFYPLVWWIRTQLVEERERACDEEVLQSGSEPEVYAEGILNVCKFYVESPLACVSGVTGADLKKRIVRIMTGDVICRLDSSRRWMLSAAGLTVVATPLVFGLLHAPLSRAQSPAQNANHSYEYEVATIKPDKANDNRIMLMGSPDGFTAKNATIQMLVRSAYGVEDNQILGAPSWLNADHYDIDAKMDSSTADELKKLSEDQRQPIRQQMMQALLADRLKLAIHHETKELPIYALVVAKNGSKLQEAKEGDTYPNGMKGADGKSHAGMMRMVRGEVTGQGLEIKALVRLLTQQLSRTVVDKTGLTGKYDFTLKWTPDESQGAMFKGPGGGPPPGGSDNAPPPDSSGPSLFTAIQEQLGLKLESQKGPVDMIVIDHVERPSEN